MIAFGKSFGSLRATFGRLLVNFCNFLDDGKRWYSGGRFSVRAIAIKGGGSGRREAKNLLRLLTLGVGPGGDRFFPCKIGFDFFLPLFSPEMSPKHSACYTFRAFGGSDGVPQNPP